MITAIEGNVYGGKSSLAQRLGSATGWIIVPEHTAFLPDGDRSDRRSWSTEQQRYVAAEVKRAELFQQCPLLLDRSVLSLAAHVTILYRLGLADIRVEFLDDLHRLWMLKRIIVPTNVIWIRCPFQVIRQRWSRDNRRGTDQLFLQPDYIQHHEWWFAALGKHFPLITIDGSRRLPPTDRLVSEMTAAHHQIDPTVWLPLLTHSVMAEQAPFPDG